MVKKSKYSKIFQKISKIQFFKEKMKKNVAKKNAIFLVFQYYEDAIWPELSSPTRFRNTEISKNHIKKSLFFNNNKKKFRFFFWRRRNNFAKKEKKKKCYPLSFPILGGRDLTRALQSSLFQISGGVPWAWRTDKGQRTKDGNPRVYFWIDWKTGLSNGHKQ